MSNLQENNNPDKIMKSRVNLKNKLNEVDLIIKWIKELKEEEKREKSLSKLSEYYDKNRNLPIYLWYSQGTMAILLQEIISTYKYLSPCKLSQERAIKICNILKLLTSIATHNEIKCKFIESKMPIFLYPFLKTTSTEKYYEYIKLLTITVISNLIISGDPEIISFFINTEIIPILLKIIDKGPLLSKIPACMMIHLIVKTDKGLKYICEEKMRYSGIVIFMRQMLKNKHNQTIINQTLKTFLRLAENNEARIILKNIVLKEIKEKNFTRHLKDSSKTLHSCLLKILSEKDEVNNKEKENKKDLNNIIGNIKGNINTMNDNIKNNLNINSQQINSNNSGETMNQYNINNNMGLMNQLNQMKLTSPYMMQNNFNEINNFNMYNNGNDNYLNKINYIGNQNNNNNNKQYMNMNFYNMYKNN